MKTLCWNDEQGDDANVSQYLFPEEIQVILLENKCEIIRPNGANFYLSPQNRNTCVLYDGVLAPSGEIAPSGWAPSEFTYTTEDGWKRNPNWSPFVPPPEPPEPPSGTFQLPDGIDEETFARIESKIAEAASGLLG